MLHARIGPKSVVLEREWAENGCFRERGPKTVVLEREWTEKRRQSRSKVLKLVFTRFYAAYR